MKKPIAEFIGTFALVLIGCGAAVIGGMGTGATSIDILGIAMAFGLTIVAMAYGIGQVSGCHINPAVSFGVLVAGRMSTSDFIAYVDRAGARRDRRRGGALSDLVGQGVGLDRIARPERLGPGLSRRIQCHRGIRLRGRRHLPLPRLHSRRHAEGRAGRTCRLGDRPDARRHPSARHQRHRHVGEPCPLARSGHCRRRDQPDTRWRRSGCSSWRR